MFNVEIKIKIKKDIEKQLGYETLFTVSSIFNDEIKIKKRYKKATWVHLSNPQLISQDLVFKDRVKKT